MMTLVTEDMTTDQIIWDDFQTFGDQFTPMDDPDAKKRAENGREFRTPRSKSIDKNDEGSPMRQRRARRERSEDKDDNLGHRSRIREDNHSKTDSSQSREHRVRRSRDGDDRASGSNGSAGHAPRPRRPVDSSKSRSRSPKQPPKESIRPRTSQPTKSPRRPPKEDMSSDDQDDEKHKAHMKRKGRKPTNKDEAQHEALNDTQRSSERRPRRSENRDKGHIGSSDELNDSQSVSSSRRPRRRPSNDDDGSVTSARSSRRRAPPVTGGKNKMRAPRVLNDSESEVEEDPGESHRGRSCDEREANNEEPSRRGKLQRSSSARPGLQRQASARPTLRKQSSVRNGPRPRSRSCDEAPPPKVSDREGHKHRRPRKPDEEGSVYSKRSEAKRILSPEKAKLNYMKSDVHDNLLSSPSESSVKPELKENNDSFQSVGDAPGDGSISQLSASESESERPDVEHSSKQEKQEEPRKNLVNRMKALAMASRMGSLLRNNVSTKVNLGDKMSLLKNMTSKRGLSLGDDSDSDSSP